VNGGIGVGRPVADGVLGNEVDGGLKDRLEKVAGGARRGGRSSKRN
jgi:hypothetical protein